MKTLVAILAAVIIAGLVIWSIQDNNTAQDDDFSSDQYFAYDAAELSRADEGDVVLFFHAPWCPTCRSLDNQLKKDIDNFPEDLTILKVDYDSSDELKDKYGVTYQHTLVQVDSRGNKISLWNGSPNLQEILNKLN